MPGIMNQIWLLADAGAVITILVIFFSFVSWVVQKIAENKNVPPPKNRPARQLPAPQAKELDEFLKRARRGQNRGGRGNVDVMNDNDLLEVVDEEPPRRQRPMPLQTTREPKRQKPKPRQQPQTPIFVDAQPDAIEIGKKALAPPVTARNQRPERPSSFDQTPQHQLNQLQAHLTEFMESGRIDKSVSQHLPSLFSELRSQLDNALEPATGDIAVAPIEDASSVRRSVIEMFHRPQQIRQAIIVNEILQRPRSITKK